MKSYTDIEQSKKLAEILQIESADMYYVNNDTNKIIIKKWKDETHDEDDIPAWSLTALFDVLPNGYVIVKNYHSCYYVESRDHERSTHIFNNPIDACYEMLLKLY